jgi:hypothetical protein
MVTDAAIVFAACRGFFDVDFIRQRCPDLADAPEADIARALLDPERADPPAPNRLFDSRHYHAMEEGPAGPVNPVLHYLTRGAAEGRSINALFDTIHYARNARLRDAAPLAAVLHALARFDTGLAAFSPFVDLPFLAAGTGRAPDGGCLADLFAGRLQHVQPHPLVDLDHLCAQAGMPFGTMQDALRLYWRADRDLAIHPLFDIDHYKAQVPGGDAIARSGYHYLVSVNPPSPHPLFDPEFYALQLGTSADRKARPRIEHFIATGAARGLSPSPYFDTAHYRARSGCDGNPLVHYLAGGYRRVSPHPMMDPAATPLFERARRPTALPLATLMALQPRQVPLSVTPDFSPDHYRKQIEDTHAAPEDLRAHFFRHGYAAGTRPNGLISVPYLKAQCRRAGIDHANPLAVYFGHGWSRRHRIVFVVPTMDDTDRNRAILALCASQLGHPDLDLVVVGGMAGPMSPAFCEVAHVWHLSSVPLTGPNAADLQGPVLRLGQALGANPARLVLVDCSEGTEIATAMSRLGLTLALHGDRGFARLSGDALWSLADCADLVVTDSAAVVQTLSDATAQRRATTPVVPGLNLDDVRLPPSGTIRARTRARLDLDADAVLVLSSGRGTLAEGADLFGALAALCGDEESAFRRAVFAWHGSGHAPRNSPLFYASHFARLSTGTPMELRLIDQPGLAAMLAAADIYVDLGRGGDGGATLSRAIAAGLPVLTMNPAADPGQDTDRAGVIRTARHDLSAARDALRHLVTDAMARRRRVAPAPGGPDHDHGLSDLIARTRAVLQHLAPDVTLQDASRPSLGRLLVVSPDAGRGLLADGGDWRQETRQGVTLTWFDLAQQDLASRHPLIAPMLRDIGCREIAFTANTDKLQVATVDSFDRSIWFLRGEVGELPVIAALGGAFDRLVTARQDQITAVSAMNPGIAARMEYLDWMTA